MKKYIVVILFLNIFYLHSQATLTAKVIGVKDGDTVVVLDSLTYQTTLRLAEVDCPEKAQAFGTRAKQFTSDAVYLKEVKYWLNGIYTTEGYFRRGYATLLIQEAIAEYGKVYVSIATEYEHKQRGDDTARQLTDQGAKLVNKLKTLDVLKQEWFMNPF